MGHSMLSELRSSAQYVVLWHIRNPKAGHHCRDELQWHTVQLQDQV